MSERATQTPSPPLLPGWWTLTRDVLTFLGGWAMIFLEIRRPEIRDSVLVLGDFEEPEDAGTQVVAS